ncbi:MAG: SdpI family protein [Clostridia bacterium]|nr:SdpI family protein [Clostridia bacterium]
MGFFIAMFLCNLLIPLIMLIGGLVMKCRPPENINHLMGYRTARSMKNAETWAFAHHLCGKIWTLCGAPLTALSALVQIPFAHAGEDAVSTMTLLLEGVQLVILIGTIPFVEHGLKRNFDDAGNRRS